MASAERPANHRRIGRRTIVPYRCLHAPAPRLRGGRTCCSAGYWRHASAGRGREFTSRRQPRARPKRSETLMVRAVNALANSGRDLTTLSNVAAASCLHSHSASSPIRISTPGFRSSGHPLTKALRPAPSPRRGPRPGHSRRGLTGSLDHSVERDDRSAPRTQARSSLADFCVRPSSIFDRNSRIFAAPSRRPCDCRRRRGELSERETPLGRQPDPRRVDGSAGQRTGGLGRRVNQYPSADIRSGSACARHSCARARDLLHSWQNCS